MLGSHPDWRKNSEMERTGSFKLLTTPQQAEALSELSRLFSDACNTLVPFVQEHRCWNRVALHHLAYYQVREKFPALGSQMVCQATHRVADAYKTLRANGGIPNDQPVPAITFTPASVNFDGSRASKRKLKAISGKEQRHVRHVNHVTSKAIVAQALRDGAGILRMEDLTHIRAHIKAKLRVRARLHRWAFRQLQDFVQYKAEAVGLRVEFVEPAFRHRAKIICAFQIILLRCLMPGHG